MSRMGLFPRRRQRLLAVTLAIAFAAGLLATVAIDSTQTGKQVEAKSIDLRYSQRGERKAPNKVVIAAIDDVTDKHLQMRFPYPRSIHADAIRQLTAAGAKSIVFDIQFLDPDPGDATGESDRSLIEAANQSGIVTFATAPDNAQAKTGPVTPLPFRGIEQGQLLDQTSVGIGISKIYPTADGVWRSLDTLDTYKVDDGLATNPYDQKIPSLSLAGYARAINKDPLTLDVPEKLNINYIGPTGLYRNKVDGYTSGFKYYNYNVVVTPGTDLSWVKGKTVLIGQTSAVGQDIHESPFSASKAGKDVTGNPTMMPGVEMHANAIENYMNKTWLKMQGLKQERLAVVALILVIWAALAFLSIGVGIIVSIGTMVAYVGYAQWMFNDNVVVPLAAPLFAAVFTFGAVVVTLTMQSYKEKRRVQYLFGRFVSPEVVRELVDVHEVIEVGGVSKEVSILFSDIRGFTSMSEHLDPSELVAQLNEYFEEMTAAVHHNQGTLDKFIGDGMMAIFGAPQTVPNHADCACAAALEMVQRLERLNRDRNMMGLPTLEIGIGIHTGKAIIGNIGSLSRLDFTAIGDTVNLASRLESSTKTVGVPILVSKSTADAASEHITVHRGSIVVKGRTQATEVFEVLAEKELQQQRNDGPATAAPPEELAS